MHQTKTKYPNGLEQFQTDLYLLSINPNIEDFLLDEIHKTVSAHDDHVIKANFYTGISAYLSPINLALKCESGSGKTYSTVQTIKFFPPEDVYMIGSQSPKVISHENGILLDKDGVPILEDPPQKPRRDEHNSDDTYKIALDDYYDELKTYREQLKDSYYQVELSNKIFTFLESVNIETFKMIKPTLSHDNDVIDHKYVDDRGKVHITRLVGFPACIFNSLDNEYMSEFATRTLTTAPTTTQPKIEAAKRISNQKASYPYLYKKESYNKRLIQEYIRQIKHAIKHHKLHMMIPFPTLHQKFRSLEVRDMRDFNHFLELVPAYTVFSLFQRPIITVDGENFVVSTTQDVLNAKTLFDQISLTTKTSTEAKILKFYYDCIHPHTNGVTINDATDFYNRKHKKMSSRTIQRWLNRLTEIEWVDAREGQQKDSRTVTYYPLQAVDRDENQTTLSSDIDTTSKDKTELSLDLKIFCQKDFDLWRKTLLTTSPPTQYKIIQMIGNPIILTKEEFCDKITGELTQCRQNEMGQSTASFGDSVAESGDKVKMSNRNVSMSIDCMSTVPEPSTAFDFDKVVSCTVIPAETRVFNQVCPACSHVGDQVWSLKFFDNTTTTCCNTCGSKVLEKQRQKEEREYEY